MKIFDFILQTHFVYLVPTLLLFSIGFYGLFLIRNNLISTLLALELLVLAVVLGFIIFSVLFDTLNGLIFVLFILTVAASESAIGLALLIVFYRLKGLISIDFVSDLKG